MSLLLALTGSAPAGYSLDCAAGAYNLTGQAAAVLRSKSLPLSAGAYAFAGKDATITYAPATGYALSCDPGSYGITGYSATVAWTPAASSSKSGVSRLWLIDYYTKAFERKEPAPLPKRVTHRKAALITQDRDRALNLKVEKAVAKAQADLDRLTATINDAKAAQAFVDSIQQFAVQSSKTIDNFMPIGLHYMQISHSVVQKKQRDDEDLLLLAFVL